MRAGQTVDSIIFASVSPKASFNVRKTGSTSLDALIEAGERAIVQLPQSNRGSAKLKGADIRPNWQNAA